MYFVDLEKIEDTKETLKLRLSVEDYFERPPGEYSFWPLEGFKEENQDVHIHNETGESETITLKRLPEYRKVPY